MPGSLTRREFLRIAGIGAAATAAGGAVTVTHMLNAAQTGVDTAGRGDGVVPSFCEMCFWKCALLAHVHQGKVWKLVGNPDDPLSNGRLCPRGTGGVGSLYDPDRLRTPLLRVHERGKDAWKPVSWDEALGTIAQRMLAIRSQYGPESVALFNHGTGGGNFKHLLYAFGSPNSVQPSFAQCRGPRDGGFILTFGEGVGSPERYDLAN